MRLPFTRKKKTQPAPMRTDDERRPHLKDGPVETIKAFAAQNSPAMFTRWPNRHELGGDDFMLIVVRGRKLCTRSEREIRRLIQRGS